MNKFLLCIFCCVLIAAYAEAQPSSIDPYQTIQAESFDDQRGVKLSNGGAAVGFIQNGDYIGFKNLAFGNEGGKSITVLASSNTSGGTIEYRLGSPTGDLVGTIDISNTGGWRSFEPFTVNNTVGFIFGTEDIYLVFRGGRGFLLDVDELFFSTEVFATGISITNCPSEIELGTTYDFDAAIFPSTTTDSFVQFRASGGTGIDTGIDISSGEYTPTSLGTKTVSVFIFSDVAEDGFVEDQCTFRVVESTSSRTGTTPKSPLANAERSPESSLNAYPNPGDGVFRLDIAPQTRVTVSDMAGRIIVPESVPGNASIDISSYPKGQYLLRTSTGQTTMLIKK